MHRCTASAAGGISQRLKPGRATMRSRARKLGTATDDLRERGRRRRSDAHLGMTCGTGHGRRDATSHRRTRLGERPPSGAAETESLCTAHPARSSAGDPDGVVPEGVLDHPGQRRPSRYPRAVPRGDGRLTHDLDPHAPGPQDACGVFGVWAPGEEVARLTYFGLYALQHRGQESAGIAVSDGREIRCHKEMGLVSQVFDEQVLARLHGGIAIGHTRYSTTGSSVLCNAQPIVVHTACGPLAVAHKGNIFNTRQLRRELEAEGIRFESTNDSEVIARCIARFYEGELAPAVQEAMT